MKKDNISLEEQWKCVTNILERVQKRGGAMLLIEQELLLNQLQGMYHGVLNCMMVAEHTLSPTEVAKRLETVVVPESIVSGLVVPTVSEDSVEMVNNAAAEVAEAITNPVSAEDPVQDEPAEPISETAEASEETDMPQFAHVPEEEVVTFHQPGMEELEGEQNKELFEEESTSLQFLDEEEVSAQPIVESELANTTSVDPIVSPTTEQITLAPESITPIAPSTEVFPHTPQPAVSVYQPVEPASQPALQPVVPTSQPQPKTQVKVSEPSLFDLLNQSRGATSNVTAVHTLGESLAQPATVVNAKKEELPLHSNKIGDLRTIININDKFSFMGELFHNNMKGYNDFISHLNALSDRSAALAYVAEIAKQYKWNEESLAVKTFYSIFDRKF